jgi:hypothetical protein
MLAERNVPHQGSVMHRSNWQLHSITWSARRKIGKHKSLTRNVPNQMVSSPDRVLSTAPLHRIWGFRLAKRRVRCLRSNESYPVKLRH